MRKNSFLFLLAVMCCAGKSYAQTQQPCFTDEVHKRLLEQHPEQRAIEDALNKQLNAGLKKLDMGKLAKKSTGDMTADTSFWYDVPVVVHFIHDYGAEYLTDNAVFDALKQWNIVYAKQNSDTSTVLPAFKKYIGNAHIRLHLANVDPLGNPTKGITRHRSYLTYVGGEPSKLDDWSPSSYVNIWVVNQMSGANLGAAAYAFIPSSAASNPYGDGVLCLYNYLNYSNTINHECGHMFNLQHPWGMTNDPAVACGDDEVDDTPPTKGHAETGCTSASLYDTSCATNYFKIYPNIHGGDSLVNYPDTTNSENIMDYTYCSKMFTKGQVARMHIALNSDVADRYKLWDTTNLVNTGAWTSSYTSAPRLDLKPIPDFASMPTIGGTTATNYLDRNLYFLFPGTSAKFVNESYNDTLTGLAWTFSNSASSPTSTSLTNVVNSFADPGWVSVSMTATGNNTGDSTKTWPRAVFVADALATDVSNYYQEFSGPDTAKWPMFNYYNNEFKWQLANVGLYDNFSVEYTGYDSRLNPLFGLYPYTGSPGGDGDDMFSVPVNLSSYAGHSCNLDFYYSAAGRSSVSLDLNDSLFIDYSANKGGWINLVKLTKGSLINRGSVADPYVPVSQTDWSPKTIPLPAGALTGYTTIRFRYKPGVGQDGVNSSGNNFYMDRISFSNLPAGVADTKMGATDVIVAPNPTNGDAFVIVKDADNTTAQVIVTDITGKVVYTTSQAISGHESRIQIPHTAIQVQGIYLVQTVTGNQTHTQKLVVY